MLSQAISDALNKQVQIEGDSSQIYLAMASWAENQGFEGIATFMYAQSDEERMHMLKLIKYINQRGGEAIIPAVIKPELDHSSFKTLFTQSLARALKSLFVTLNFVERVRFSVLSSMAIWKRLDTICT